MFALGEEEPLWTQVAQEQIRTRPAACATATTAAAAGILLSLMSSSLANRAGGNG